MDLKRKLAKGSTLEGQKREHAKDTRGRAKRLKGQGRLGKRLDNEELKKGGTVKATCCSEAHNQIQYLALGLVPSIILVYQRWWKCCSELKQAIAAFLSNHLGMQFVCLPTS